MANNGKSNTSRILIALKEEVIGQEKAGMGSGELKKQQHRREKAYDKRSELE